MGARIDASPRWQQLYQAAILETDTSLLLRRIVVAEGAITDRINELDCDPDSSFSERSALANACIMLRCLRRVADEGKAA